MCQSVDEFNFVGWFGLFSHKIMNLKKGRKITNICLKKFKSVAACVLLYNTFKKSVSPEVCFIVALYNGMNSHLMFVVVDVLKFFLAHSISSQLYSIDLAK